MEIEKNNKIIDIHSHLLPGVDDGASSIDESVKMIEIYIENGYDGAILTPHFRDKYRKNKSELEIAFNELKNELRLRHIEFELYLGNEIYADECTVKNVKSGNICTMANSRYVLLEFPFHSEPAYANDLIFELRAGGYIPIVAHVERYSYIHRNVKILYGWIENGALVQVNIDSFCRSKNEQTYKAAVHLLKSNVIDFIATDSHSSTWRSPNVKDTLEMLLKIKGEIWFEKVIVNNPQKILRDEAITRDLFEISVRDNGLNNRGLLKRILERLGL